MKVIVIGAGAAGLAVAASLAKMGARVTAYEKNKEAGGVLAPLSRDGFVWSRPYALQRFLPGQFFARWLKEMGQELPSERVSQRFVFPDFTLEKPEGAAPGWLERTLAERFPKEKRGLRKFFAFCDRMRAIAAAQEKIEFDSSTALKRSVIWNYLFVARYVDLRADALLDRFVKDGALKRILLSVLIERGVAPGEFAGIGLPMHWSEALFDEKAGLDRADGLAEVGACRITGGTGKLAEALCAAIRERGGEIVTGKAVKKVKIEKNAVRAVLLEDGTEDKAEEGEALTVVIACDPRPGLLRLVGKESLPGELLETLEGQRLRPSAFVLHLGLSAGLRLPQGVTHVFGEDAASVAASLERGEFDPEKQGYILYPGDAAPEGREALSILAFTPRHAEGIDWTRDRERLAELLTTLAERQIPHLTEAVTTRVIETPEDFAAFGNEAGCVGGLSPVMGAETLPHAVEGVRGLYLAGQCTGGGGGVGTVMRGAWQTAKAIESDYFLDATQGKDDEEDDLDDLDA